MINTNILAETVEDQFKSFTTRDKGIRRDILFEKYLKTKQITVISGIRHSGKSTLLSQFAGHFKSFYYLNFDDDRLLNFSVKDFQSLMLVFKQRQKSKVIFLDEIQSIDGWEKFVRRLHDESYKIFLTGSNAKLLSSELATHLTGRYVKLELYPFSFKEFLVLKKIDYDDKAMDTRATILKHFAYYLKNGGFPEFLKHNDAEFLKRVYSDILYKDLLIRFKIREVKAFRQLAAFLFSNFTKEISYNSLKNSLGFKSATSVKNYIEYLQESFLLFELAKYDFSLKKQFVSDKKAFVIDNGLRNTVAFYFSEDYGKLLENLVFVELKRRGKEVYYFKAKRECDFLIKEKSLVVELIQVSRFVEAGVNEEREINGLIEAMEMFGLKKGMVLTENQEEERTVAGKKIRILPVWKWLLQ